MAESRTAILERFRRKIAQGMPIIGGGAGTGISAKFEEAGGIDLIVIYNSGRFRMAGHGSLAGLLPYGDANAIVMQMAAEVLPVVRHTPVLAGVCATDPMRLMDRFLREVKEAGFAGVQNFPTVGLFDGTFRVNLEETGFGYDKEVEMIRLAREIELLTTPYVFNSDEARRMAEAGADILVAHMGLTTKGSIGAQTAKTLATEAPSPNPKMPGSSSNAAGRSMASTAPVPWNVCPPSGPSSSRPRRLHASGVTVESTCRSGGGRSGLRAAAAQMRGCTGLGVSRAEPAGSRIRSVDSLFDCARCSTAARQVCACVF